MVVNIENKGEEQIKFLLFIRMLIPVGTNWFEKWESVFFCPFPLYSEVEHEACYSSTPFMAAFDHQQMCHSESCWITAKTM